MKLAKVLTLIIKIKQKCRETEKHEKEIKLNDTRFYAEAARAHEGM